MKVSWPIAFSVVGVVYVIGCVIEPKLLWLAVLLIVLAFGY